MTKNEKVEKLEKYHNLIYTIGRGFQPGIHTYGTCKNKCGNSARGSGLCTTCATKELAELLGNGYLANKISNLIQYKSEAIFDGEEVIANNVEKLS